MNFKGGVDAFLSVMAAMAAPGDWVAGGDVGIAVRALHRIRSPLQASGWRPEPPV